MAKKQTLVDLKTAQQAKENGFVDGCLYYYDKTDTLRHYKHISNNVHPVLGYNFNHRYSNEVGNKYPISAPTKEQHELWLRK
jgi:hypothetical protein